FSPREAKVEEFKVGPGQDVFRDQDLAVMWDAELAQKIQQLQGEIRTSQLKIGALTAEITNLGNLGPARSDERLQRSSEKLTEVATRNLKLAELEIIQRRTHCVPQSPGH